MSSCIKLILEIDIRFLKNESNLKSGGLSPNVSNLPLLNQRGFRLWDVCPKNFGPADGRHYTQREFVFPLELIMSRFEKQTHVFNQRRLDVAIMKTSGNLTRPLDRLKDCNHDLHARVVSCESLSCGRRSFASRMGTWHRAWKQLRSSCKYQGGLLLKRCRQIHSNTTTLKEKTDASSLVAAAEVKSYRGVYFLFFKGSFISWNSWMLMLKCISLGGLLSDAEG